jgi:MtN3 and saliva related transmembrane protein|tara:strand:- start:392 stop:679 length:288 start_codon:yes stop_codon:yes gene_type:complete
MMNDYSIEIIGLIAGFLGVIAWVPQIYRIWIKKKADGISLPTFLVITTALILWLIYGIIIESFSLIISNIFTLVMILFVLIGAWKIQRETNNIRL